jgi:hypothetical protein
MFSLWGLVLFINKKRIFLEKQRFFAHFNTEVKENLLPGQRQQN